MNGQENRNVVKASHSERSEESICVYTRSQHANEILRFAQDDRSSVAKDFAVSLDENGQVGPL